MALTSFEVNTVCKRVCDDVAVRLQAESQANGALVAGTATGLIYAVSSGEGLYVLDVAPALEFASREATGR